MSLVIVIGTIAIILILIDSLLPAYIKPIAILGLALSAGFIGYSISNAKNERAISALKVELAQKSAESSKVNEVIVEKLVPTIKYVERIKIVKVSDFIPPEVDLNINNGLVVLHDSIVDEIDPKVPSNVNDSTGIKLSQVAEVVKQNYAICIDNSKRLGLLQEWVIEQGRIYK